MLGKKSTKASKPTPKELCAKNWRLCDGARWTWNDAAREARLSSGLPRGCVTKTTMTVDWIAQRLSKACRQPTASSVSPTFQPTIFREYLSVTNAKYR